MIDFKKKLSANNLEKKTEPIELYKTLDRKSVAGPLRPAQEYILKKWYEERKDERDLIIKLHTGEGKTLIGLLILQSELNAKNGPCIYVCPNIYLAKQVCQEAEKFGILYCIIGEDKEIPSEFLSGEKILITHAQKLFNGKSVFGISNKFVKVGNIILDDSHACIDVIKNAYSLTISKNSNEDIYMSLLTLFDDDLRDQGEGSLIDIKDGDYETFMPIPYWSWFDKKTETLKILSKHSDTKEIRYAWSLIRDNILDFSCFISGSKIEISPNNFNVDTFGSFSKADKRILMSATTQDDSFFIKGLSFKVEAVKNPLINSLQKWSGEKMLLIPSLINEELDRELVLTRFSKIKNNNFGIVSLVSSTKIANYYANLGAIITDRMNIFDKIEIFKKGNFENILVVNNRYDGIDLPDESCRVLIIDSLPYFDSLSDRYEERCRPYSEIINKRIAQKIEQGIGRGVRGEKDYCAILVLGNDIVKFMRSITTIKYFSEQTQKQIEIGLELAKMLKEEKEESDDILKPVVMLLRQMLNRDEGWKEYYAHEMNQISLINDDSIVYERLIEELNIEKLFSNGEYVKASEKVQNIIDKADGDLERGWYLQQLAKIMYFESKEQSIAIQKSAFKLNSDLLKPKTGIDYTKVTYINQNRMNRIRKYLCSIGKYTELKLYVDELLDNLSFGIEANKFEKSLESLGELLGFISQRPDKDIRKGPDNLWCGSNNYYLMFECKSEVQENRGEISKSEAGQMNNHSAWFDSEYGTEVSVDRFLIIPTKDLSYYANFTHSVQIIRRSKLNEFKRNIKSFILELKSFELNEVTDENLQRLLDTHGLNMRNFKEKYSENYYHKSRK